MKDNMIEQEEIKEKVEVLENIAEGFKQFLVDQNDEDMNDADDEDVY